MKFCVPDFAKINVKLLKSFMKDDSVDGKIRDISIRNDVQLEEMSMS